MLHPGDIIIHRQNSPPQYLGVGSPRRIKLQQLQFDIPPLLVVDNGLHTIIVQLAQRRNTALRRLRHIHQLPRSRTDDLVELAPQRLAGE